jgi:hypothetical protein
MTTQPPADFTVDFSKKVARVINYDDSMGRIEFTFDGSEKGNKWVVLEHHPADWPRGPRYDIAFQRTKQFLETCGFGVEVYGE